MIGEIGIGHERADAQAPAGRRLDLAEGKPGDVDQRLGLLDIHLHEIDQIGAAGDEFGARAAGHQAHRLGDAAGPRILEIDHGWPIACWPIAC